LRPTLIIIGLLLLSAGAFVTTQSTQTLTPYAELTGLAAQVPMKQVLVSPTRYPVAASSYGYQAAELQAGVPAEGSLEVITGHAVTFYVMDDQNFAQYKKDLPNQLVLSRQVSSSYNFTFTPKLAGTYYFVFQNQETTKCDVIFHVNVLKNATVLNPLFENLGYELAALGIVLFAIGVKTGKRKPRPERDVTAVMTTGVRCRFCSTDNPPNEAFCLKCGRAQQ
jgi:hypothetical protein